MGVFGSSNSFKDAHLAYLGLMCPPLWQDKGGTSSPERHSLFCPFFSFVVFCRVFEEEQLSVYSLDFNENL